ncbi:MAG: hypothetical protein HY812_20370 [Planctomycetes bacterium]|nr:hypothetical protein [Planctomycetota bacterium]
MEEDRGSKAGAIAEATGPGPILWIFAFTERFWNEISSSSIRVGASPERRARPRLTARRWMPSTSREIRCIGSATALVLASPSQSITRASNNAVNRLPGSAHGTAI